MIFLQNFLELHTHIKNKTEVKLDLANYATKSGLKTQHVWIHLNLLKQLI